MNTAVAFRSKEPEQKATCGWVWLPALEKSKRKAGARARAQPPPIVPDRSYCDSANAAGHVDLGRSGNTESVCHCQSHHIGSTQTPTLLLCTSSPGDMAHRQQRDAWSWARAARTKRSSRGVYRSSYQATSHTERGSKAAWGRAIQKFRWQADSTFHSPTTRSIRSEVTSIRLCPPTINARHSLKCPASPSGPCPSLSCSWGHSTSLRASTSVRSRSQATWTTRGHMLPRPRTMRLPHTMNLPWTLPRRQAAA